MPCDVSLHRVTHHRFKSEKKTAINKSAFVAIPNDKSKSRHGMTRDEKRIHRRFTFTYTHRAPTVVEIDITAPPTPPSSPSNGT